MSALANHLDAVTETPTSTNAANAQFSTGPKTSAGKDRVKLNALKSGIYAQTVVLPDEDKPAFEALGSSLNARWQPSTDAERKAVLEIQNATWRRDRAAELDSSLFAIGAQQQLEAVTEQFPDLCESARYAMARAADYQANAKTFDQLWRQEGRLQRALDRAEREMQHLVAARPSAKPTPAPAARPAATQESMPTGFVSTNHRNMPNFIGKNAEEQRRQWLRKHASV